MYIFKITKAKPRADQINLLGVFDCNILFNTISGKYRYNFEALEMHSTSWVRFNTVNDKYCCN